MMRAVVLEFEKAKLSELEDLYRPICSAIQVFESNLAQYPPLIAVDGFRAQFYEWHRFFDGYHDVAMFLRDSGLARFSERRFEIQRELIQAFHRLLSQRRELAEVYDIFRRMAQESKEHQAIRAKIIADTQTEILRIQQQMAEQTRQNHAEWNARWRTAFHAGSSLTPGSNIGSFPTYQPPPPPQPLNPWLPPPLLPNSNFPSQHYGVCPVWECGKWCIQPAGHGGPCHCDNNHSGYW